MKKKKFSDFAQEPGPLDGPKVKIDDLLNKEIEILTYRLAESRYSKNSSGKYATVQFSGNDGVKQVFFSGSDILIEQLEKYQSELPFVVIIKKINRYYTFS